MNKSNHRGFSSVLTSILLTGVMITIGLGIWGYAMSASSALSSDYFEDVIESVYNIMERFDVENVAINITSPPSVRIYVHNYGEITINISKVIISAMGNSTEFIPSIKSISSGGITYYNIPAGDVPIKSGISLSIKTESERGNKAYEVIWIP